MYKELFQHNNQLTRSFNIKKGVIHGDRSTLFNIFNNDLKSLICSSKMCPVKIVHSNLGSLLYAHYIIILSGESGLQNSLYWDFSVCTVININ